MIGAPMYNFSMPSTLKAWLDYVHVIGATSPADEGVAPLRSKPVTVVSARATPTGADPRADFVLGPLYTILGGFMGMDRAGIRSAHRTARCRWGLPPSLRSRP